MNEKVLSGNAAEFCTRHFADELRRFGFSTVQDQGDVVLGGEILEFMVVETNTYKGDVRLKLTLKKQGKTEWTGVNNGDLRALGPLLQGRELLRDHQRLAPACRPEPRPGRGLSQGAGRAMNKRPRGPAR
jgi:hypothetical protein